ncbi:MAG: VOC family protein [Caulobacteraceae bacterium]
MKPKISLITLGVRDMARSLAFYRDGLGFRPRNYKDGDDHVMFEMEGSWLALYPWNALAEDALVPSEGSGFSGVTLLHNVKTKHDADQVFALAVSVGARPVKTPRDVFWGGYSGYVADPDGHLWEIAWSPFKDVDLT